MRRHNPSLRRDARGPEERRRDMKRVLIVLASAIALTGLAGVAHAAPQRVGFSLGINVASPGYYRPWGYYPAYGYGYYRPYPVYVAPAPVIVRPAPVVLEPAPVVIERAPVVVQPAPVVRALSDTAP